MGPFGNEMLPLIITHQPDPCAFHQVQVVWCPMNPSPGVGSPFPALHDSSSTLPQTSLQSTTAPQVPYLARSRPINTSCTLKPTSRTKLMAPHDARNMGSYPFWIRSGHDTSSHQQSNFLSSKPRSRIRGAVPTSPQCDQALLVGSMVHFKRQIKTRAGIVVLCCSGLGHSPPNANALKLSPSRRLDVLQVVRPPCLS